MSDRRIEKIQESVDMNNHVHCPQLQFNVHNDSMTIVHYS